MAIQTQVYLNPSGTRYRISLEQRHDASTTIDLRLAAVRRLTYEAADCGLLSADLAAGIGRVKGTERLGVPVGNWLTAEQGKRLLLTADAQASEASAAMPLWRFCLVSGYAGRN